MKLEEWHFKELDDTWVSCRIAAEFKT